MSEHLHTAVSDGVGWITLDRPDKLNAFTDDMMAAAAAAVDAYGADDAVGAVVVTGTGRAFSTGGDVATMAAGDELAPPDSPMEAKMDTLRRWHEFPARLRQLPKPTVAMINGVAAGAGIGLALACDLRVCSDQARLGTAYARVGYGGDFGTTYGLTRLLGEAKAKELFFLPDLIDAAEAHRIGLVNRVFPHEALEAETRAIAGRLAAGPRVSYRYMKENIHLAGHLDYRAMLEREALTHVRCGETADHAEGVHAFMEKREPKFRGR